MSDEGFEAFFRREFHRLVRFLLARGFREQAAADAAQEAMHAAYEQWEQIDNPVGWVRVVALRGGARDVRGDVARANRDQAFAALTFVRTAPDPAQLVELADENQAVLKRIADLSPSRQKVLAMVFDGYSVDEIAQQLEIAKATVRSHMRHIRQSLDDRIGGAS